MTRPETPSAGPPSLSEERLAELMVKVVDEVASPAEREELMSYLVSHPEERAELDAQRAIRAVTRGWGARLEADLRARQASSWQLTAQRLNHHDPYDDVHL